MGAASDTIAALSTVRGRSGVAVIRVSGPMCRALMRRLVGAELAPRYAHLREIRDGEGTLLDEGLVLFFPGPNSFTGEDCLEFQTHGSIAVTDAVLRAIALQPDCRLAEAGEFTRRAFVNGKLDLAQAEGLADLLEAETEVQRQQALEVLRRGLSEEIECWRRNLLRAVALVEATVDFADEDVPVDVWPEVTGLLEDVRVGLGNAAAGSAAAEAVRSGFEVALVGAPNVGKSTLLNALAGREAALVSEIAGTTRDVIEVRLSLAGLPVTFLDLAGLRDTVDVVEGLGISRARERARDADLRIFLTDGEADPGLWREGDILVVPKADLADGERFAVSGKTGQGVDRLLERVGAELSQRVARRSLVTRERQRIGIEKGHVRIVAALALVARGAPEEVISEEIRTAIRELESVVGYIGVESVLGEIFSSFCIGK